MCLFCHLKVRLTETYKFTHPIASKQCKHNSPAPIATKVGVKTFIPMLCIYDIAMDAFTPTVDWDTEMTWKCVLIRLTPAAGLTNCEAFWLKAAKRQRLTSGGFNGWSPNVLFSYFIQVEVHWATDQTTSGELNQQWLRRWYSCTRLNKLQRKCEIKMFYHVWIFLSFHCL